MGRPKHLLTWQGTTLLERTVGLLQRWTGEAVLLGTGEVPPTCRHLRRLPDVGGVSGPLAGVLAGLRDRQDRAWMIVSCDLPLLSDAALEWLIGHRRLGRVAVLPEISRGFVEPLCAIYEPDALPLLEVLVGTGAGPSGLAQHPAALVVRVPVALASAWCGVNTPEELAALAAAGASGVDAV